MLYDGFNNVTLSPQSSTLESWVATGVPYTCISTSGQQRLHHRQTTSLGGQNQRCLAVAVESVLVGPSEQQGMDTIRIYPLQIAMWRGGVPLLYRQRGLAPLSNM
ncbi:unnamed protein product [Ectocarpus sp. 4 AP-2014]